MKNSKISISILSTFAVLIGAQLNVANATVYVRFVNKETANQVITEQAKPVATQTTKSVEHQPSGAKIELAPQTDAKAAERRRSDHNLNTIKIDSEAVAVEPVMPKPVVVLPDNTSSTPVVEIDNSVANVPATTIKENFPEIIERSQEIPTRENHNAAESTAKLDSSKSKREKEADRKARRDAEHAERVAKIEALRAEQEARAREIAEKKADAKARKIEAEKLAEVERLAQENRLAEVAVMEAAEEARQAEFERAKELKRIEEKNRLAKAKAADKAKRAEAKRLAKLEKANKRKEIAQAKRDRKKAKAESKRLARLAAQAKKREAAEARKIKAEEVALIEKENVPTPPEVKNKPKRSISDYRNRVSVGSLVKDFFGKYNYEVLESDFGVYEPVFPDQAPNDIDELANLLGVKKSQIVTDNKTRTVVINWPSRDGEIAIGDVFVSSEYGNPLQAYMPIKHDRSMTLKGDVSSVSHLLENAIIKPKKTSYGTLVHIFGENNVNNSFTLNAIFEDVKSGAASTKDVYVKPNQPSK